MANPRYPQPEERQSPKDRRLSQVLQLVAAQNALAEPQVRQQQVDQQGSADRARAALSMLGLIQEMQNAQATQGYREGELGLKRQELGLRERELGAHTAQSGRNAEIAMLTSRAERGDEAAIKTLGIMQSEYGKQQGLLHQQDVQKGVLGALPGLRAIYAGPGDKIAGQLSSIQPSIQPDVWNALPWDELNLGIGQQKPAEVGAFTGRTGGVIPNTVDAVNPYHVNEDMMRTLAEGVRKRRAGMTPEQLYNDQHPLDGLWNTLFGNPTH